MAPPITAERILSLSAPLNSVSVRWLFQQLVGRPFDEIGPETADIAYLIYNTLISDGRTERVEIDPVDGKKDYIYSRQIEATGRPDTLPDRSAQQILAQAASAIDQRAASRDLPNERSMARAVGAFNVLAGKSMSETEGWLFMAILKASRATAGTHHPDDYTDGASYFALAGESAAAEERQTPAQKSDLLPSARKD